MQPALLLTLQVLIYAAFPIYFAGLRSQMRQILLYLYAGVVLAMGGFLGSVHTYPLAGGVEISSGSVAYAALMMTTLVLVFVERDVQVVRNVVRLVIAVNVFKALLYGVTVAALRSDDFPNPFDTSPSVFSVSLRVVLVGGVLIVLELLVLLFALERLKSSIASPPLLRTLYVVCFVAVLCLDGVLFPLAVASPGEWGALISSGVQAKLVLGLAYAVPLLGFLWAFRKTMATYEATPLRLQELVFARRDTIIEALVQEREARAASDRQLAEASELARSMAAIDRDRPIEEVLTQLRDVLHPLPGVRAGSLAVIAGRPDDGVVGFGHVAGAPIGFDELARRSGGDPWLDRRDLHDVACVPVRTDGDVAAILQVSVERRRSMASLATLGDLSFELSAILQPSLRRACEGWTDRSPILRILETGGISPVFQPVVTMVDRVTRGFEGLSRFDGDLATETVFRRAARLGLGIELELLAVARILEAARSLPAGLPVSVNLSMSTAISVDLGEVLRRRDRPVKLEITEHEQMDDYDTLLGALRDLDDVRLVVDDAGSGYASLQHILRLRPDEVKLDRAWVQGIDVDRPRQVLIGGLRSFVEEVGATLVAEGIEREAEAATLQRLGVVHGQGYLFGRPAPVAAFAAGRP